MENKNKKSYAVFIVLISLFICAVIIWSLYTNNPLTSQHIILIMLLSIIGLSFSFDKLMLGKLFSIEKNIENVKNQQQELSEENNKIKQENLQFKQDLFSYMLNSINQISSQNQNTNLNQPITVNTVNSTANVLPDENTDKSLLESQIDEEDGSETNNGESINESVQQAILNANSNKPILRNDASIMNLIRVSEVYAINTVAKKLGFPLRNLSYQVKISFSEDSLFKGRSRGYDAFFDSGNMHYFIDVIHGPMRERVERVFGMISDVRKYSEINKIPAKMILILVNHPNERGTVINLDRESERIAALLQPAIENNFFTIETVKFDFESYKATMNESAVGKEE